MTCWSHLRRSRPSSTAHAAAWAQDRRHTCTGRAAALCSAWCHCSYSPSHRQHASWETFGSGKSQRAFTTLFLAPSLALAVAVAVADRQTVAALLEVYVFSSHPKAGDGSGPSAMEHNIMLHQRPPWHCRKKWTPPDKLGGICSLTGSGPVVAASQHYRLCDRPKHAADSIPGSG
jgi:hypothetical protein